MSLRASAKRTRETHARSVRIVCADRGRTRLGFSRKAGLASWLGARLSAKSFCNIRAQRTGSGKGAHVMTARTMVLTVGALLGLVGPSVANGDGLFPLRLNYQFSFRLRLEHQALPPSSVAPWYMWWPADANETLMQRDFQTSPYPTWSPQQGAMRVRRTAALHRILPGFLQLEQQLQRHTARAHQAGGCRSRTGLPTGE